MNTTDLEQVFQNCACFRARAVARRLTRDYEEALKGLGLKATQFTILAVIKGRPPHSIKAMADKLAMERTSLVRTLNLMEKNGWIKLAPEGYRRERSMQLTAKGEKLLEKALPLWKKSHQQFEQRVGAQKWQDNKQWFLDIAFGDD